MTGGSGRLLGVDWGERRIGLALSDETQTLAQPLATLTRRTGKRFPMRQLLTLVDRHGVTGVVVGLPLDQDGAEGEAASAARTLAAAIAQHSGKPVALWDERLTTARGPTPGRHTGGQHPGPKGRRRRAGGHGAAAALPRCQTGLRLVTMRSAECGMRNGPRRRRPAERARRIGLTLQFRIPNSAFRIGTSFGILLVGAATACGSSDGPRVTVTVPAGATLEAAVDSLAANRVIDHSGMFRLYARLRGLAGSLKSGVYLLRQDEAWSDVVGALQRGRGVEQRFTVREGLRLAEIADLAQRGLRIPRDSFLDAAQDSALLAQLGLPEQAASVEGYLFPTTYLLPQRIGARELVKVMTHQFIEQWSPEWQARLDSLHFTRHQLVTLASIIESEVRYDPARPFISAVYQNRLKRGMRLEADPTVSYAYGRRLKRVWEKNLAVRSSYNTYLHAGLPPGPISQPGRPSLTAALYPAAVPFLYFVAQADGKHIFSVTYAEHLAAIRRVKEMRRAARAPHRPAR